MFQTEERKWKYLSKAQNIAEMWLANRANEVRGVFLVGYIEYNYLRKPEI